MKDEFKYKAFISYSHRDSAMASKLHRALESYRPPGRIVGKPSRDGIVAKRLAPIFRDREELPTSSDLGQSIQDALENSAYLVVLCSPYAAASRWVNEEIRHFKTLGRSNRILCVILSGEPNASDMPEGGELECFPKALRYHLSADGTISDQRCEPIAADLRPGGETWSDAKLKIAAGLIGVGFDQLKQRHVRRARTRMAQALACTILLAAGLGSWWHGEQKAKAQLTRKSQLERWVEAGRQELINGSSQRAAAWLKEAYFQGFRDHVTRYLLAKALEPMELPQMTISDSDDPIVNAFFLPTKDRLLTVHESGKSKLRNTSDGSVLALLDWRGPPVMLAGHARPTRHVLASFNGDQITCWSMEDGERRATLTGHGATVTCFETSVSGNLAITGSEDRTAQIWNLTTGAVKATLMPHGGSVTCALISPDERWATTSSTDGHVRIWDAESGALLKDLGDIGGSGVQMITSEDGRAIAVLTFNGLVAGWETAQWQQAWRMAPTSNRPLRIFFGHPNAPLAAVIADESTYSLRLIDVADGHLVAEMKGHTAPLGGVSLASNYGMMASQSMDRTVRLWDLNQGKALAEFDPDTTFSPFEGVGQSVDLSPDGDRLLRLGPGGDLIIWHLARGLRMEGIESGGEICRVDFDAAGNRMSGWQGNQAFIWSTEQPAPLKKWQNNDGFDISECRLNSKGSYAILATVDGKSRIWDVESGTISKPFDGVESFDLVSSLDDCAFRMSDGTIAVVNLLTQNIKTRITLPPITDGLPIMSSATVKVSPDGDLAAVAAGVRLHLVSLRTGQLAGTFAGDSEKAVMGFAWNHDGSRLLVWRETLAEIWSPDGTLVATTSPSHQFTLQTACFNALGDRFATAGGDGFVHVFDGASGRLLSSIKVGATFVSLASLSPDGKFLVASCNETGVTVWDVDSGRMLGMHAGQIAKFSPNGNHLALMGSSVELLPFRLEDRTEGSLAGLLDKKLQWKVAEDKLVPINTSHPREAETPRR